MSLRHFRRVLILGHTGFIGGHLLRHLADRRPACPAVGLALPSPDLTDWDQARQLAEWFDPETAVVMCAAIKRQLGDNLETFSRNLAMVVNVCRILETQSVARFVYLSSTAVYGEDTHQSAITEETPVDPTSNYGIAKYASERLLGRVCGGARGVPLVVLRLPLVYGPGDQGLYGPSGFVQAAVQGRPVQLWGDGTEAREFRFVEDVANILTEMILHTHEGVVNGTVGVRNSFREAAECVAALAPGVRIDSRARNRPPVDHLFAGGLLRQLCPGFSLTPLAEGIRRTYHAESARFRQD
jgi:nucleoside-diphosphate-sugar epimerase